MKTDPLCKAHPRSDASLVEATLGGDQSAFAESRMLGISLPYTGRRWMLLTTIAAGALLVFCLFDTNHHVGRLSSTELTSLLATYLPATSKCEYWKALRVRFSVIRRGSTVDSGWRFIETVPDDAIRADFDQAALNLMAQRGIACPILVQGRDFEILGAAGRYLPFLAVFIVSIGTVFLLRMRRSVMQFSRTHA
jgi:hypothetical protein